MKNIGNFIVFLTILLSPISSFAKTEDVEKRVQAAEARAVTAEKRALEAEKRALEAEKELNKTKQSSIGEAEKRLPPQKRREPADWKPPF